MRIKTTITIQSANKQCNGEYLRIKIQFWCVGDWQREWRRIGKSATVSKQKTTTTNLFEKMEKSVNK